MAEEVIRGNLISVSRDIEGKQEYIVFRSGKFVIVKIEYELWVGVGDIIGLTDKTKLDIIMSTLNYHG